MMNEKTFLENGMHFKLQNSTVQLFLQLMELSWNFVMEKV